MKASSERETISKTGNYTALLGIRVLKYSGVRGRKWGQEGDAGIARSKGEHEREMNGCVDASKRTMS